MSEYVAEILELANAKNPGETEFLQTVQEIVESLAPVLAKTQKERQEKIVERMT